MSTAILAEPGQSASTSTASLQVIKRNGALVGFDVSKISVAVTKAFLAVEGDEAAGSARIHDSVRMSQAAAAAAKRGNQG